MYLKKEDTPRIVEIEDNGLGPNLDIRNGPKRFEINNRRQTKEGVGKDAYTETLGLEGTKRVGQYEAAALTLDGGGQENSIEFPLDSCLDFILLYMVCAQ